MTVISQFPATNSHDEDTMNMDLTAKTAPMRKKINTIDFDPNFISREYFRQIDPDVMLLFEKQLVLQYPLADDRVGEALGLLEFK